MDFIFEPLAILLIIVSILIAFVRRRLTYWQRSKIPSLQATVPFGNLENPITGSKSQGFQYKLFYQKLKEMKVRYGGVYSFLAPVFIPVDPEIIKIILTKDFRNFHARGFYYNEEDQPISANLFTIDGGKWKNLRVKLSHAFTPTKIRSVCQTVLSCALQMENGILEHAHEGRPLNAKEITSFYTTDVIGSCAFGVDCNSFKDSGIGLFKVIRSAMDEATRLLKGAFMYSFQGLARKLKLVLFPRDAVSYFTEFMLDTISHREKHGVRREDFLQVLIELKDREFAMDEGVGKLTTDDILAQSLMFFIAGFDTSSITMSFCLFELAQHPEIQEKAREDVNAVLLRHDGRVTYDSIREMKYLRQVLDETMRKYPGLPLLHRKCTERYGIPGTDVVIESGTQIIVPTLGIHYDPEFYPEPERFDPDRFTEANRRNRNPYIYLPFGEGPRSCVGKRFGLITSMIGLAVLLRKFAFSLNAETALPVKFSSFLMLQTESDILFDVHVIDESS